MPDGNEFWKDFDDTYETLLNAGKDPDEIAALIQDTGSAFEEAARRIREGNMESGDLDAAFGTYI